MPTIYFQNAVAVFALNTNVVLTAEQEERISWLLNAARVPETFVAGCFIGPRKEMVSPWSTNATEIAANVGVPGISRLEQFFLIPSGSNSSCDPMLESRYQRLDQDTLRISLEPKPLRHIEDLRGYNSEHGLALSDDEISFLEQLSRELDRPLTDCEVYGFSQINSEHCRHKIFNGTFVINGERQPHSLFELIKQTSSHAGTILVSAYKDNVAFIKGPHILQFTPMTPYEVGRYTLQQLESVISLKAETHNFPTTVEPFNGASTGSGGEIRDRMAGGRGSLALAGTAVYMTSYPRLRSETPLPWEQSLPERSWKYQSPAQILTKASNGASDFGNKFGQPLITGSLLTFEACTERGDYAFDRTIMLAGGIGYANAADAIKAAPKKGDKVILLGGDNYRIGMAGGSVSSVDTGRYSEALELSAVQRANPEMQKRVYNVIRALAESTQNPIKLVHDHGAGGHINCFSELLEQTGGRIDIRALPLGDPTLSAKEIICNESQERMGLIISEDDLPLLQSIAERERAPIYVVGEATGDQKILFEDKSSQPAFALPLAALLGGSPKTVLTDSDISPSLPQLAYAISSGHELVDSLEAVLTLEGVACKDWLTNKVDRSVTGLVAQQQCVGPLQLPLADVGVSALDYRGQCGIAVALGHAPAAGLIDEHAGAILSITESLTNLVWAPLKDGLDSVVLSANWMWPAKQPGEDARLYKAVEACSSFAQALAIPIPTGKDSLSMTMKYADGRVVKAPGTVIITACGECCDVRQCATPDLKHVSDSVLLYIDLSGTSEYPLGGSSFAQTLSAIGSAAPTAANPAAFRAGFNTIQKLIKEELILAGHDISSGGLITALAEMAFAGDLGIEIDLSAMPHNADPIAALYCEKPSVVIQVADRNKKAILDQFSKVSLPACQIAVISVEPAISLKDKRLGFTESLSSLRRVWQHPSHLLDLRQCEPAAAESRRESFDRQGLNFILPDDFTGRAMQHGIDLFRRKSSGITAAIIREKGTNGEREMAYSLHAAGFDVRDVTMSDLIAGRETLEQVRFIAFPGGFSNSDVLGAARGWAGTFRYNDRTRAALESFYQRPDTLSLGVCNGCQLMTVLDLIYPEHSAKVVMDRNASKKFESAFLSVDIAETGSIMLKPLAGSRLGIWVAHGEGKFHLPEGESGYDIALRYTYSSYPANPNQSDFNAAGIVSKDGRHLAMMPHLERAIFPWQWGYCRSTELRKAEISPWLLAFRSAYEWICEN